MKERPDMANTNIDSEEIFLPAVMEANEELVSTRFWRKARQVAGNVPFMDDLVAAYYCALDPKTPRRVRGTLLAALAYFIVPTDMIPDFILGLGFTDDATVLATVIAMVSGHIKQEHQNKARIFLRKLPLEDDKEK